MPQEGASRSFGLSELRNASEVALMKSVSETLFSKRFGAELHFGVVFFVSMLYFAGISIPYGVIVPIWGLFNLLLVPQTYRKVFQTPEVTGTECPRCHSIMKTTMMKCANPSCGWVLKEPAVPESERD